MVTGNPLNSYISNELPSRWHGVSPLMTKVLRLSYMFIDHLSSFSLCENTYFLLISEYLIYDFLWHNWGKLNIDWIFMILGLISGEGNGIPLQYSCLENPMDRGAWWAAVHGIAKSQTRLSNFTFTFHFPALEKEMATHSSVLAWRIPGTGEPSGLPSMGSHRVGHDWSDLAA